MQQLEAALLPSLFKKKKTPRFATTMIDASAEDLVITIQTAPLVIILIIVLMLRKVAEPPALRVRDLRVRRRRGRRQPDGLVASSKAVRAPLGCC